jgi:hypothetical protein
MRNENNPFGGALAALAAAPTAAFAKLSHPLNRMHTIRPVKLEEH